MTDSKETAANALQAAGLVAPFGFGYALEATGALLHADATADQVEENLRRLAETLNMSYPDLKSQSSFVQNIVAYYNGNANRLDTMQHYGAGTLGGSAGAKIGRAVASVVPVPGAGVAGSTVGGFVGFQGGLMAEDAVTEGKTLSLDGINRVYDMSLEWQSGKPVTAGDVFQVLARKLPQTNQIEIQRQLAKAGEDGAANVALSNDHFILPQVRSLLSEAYWQDPSACSVCEDIARQINAGAFPPAILMLNEPAMPDQVEQYQRWFCENQAATCVPDMECGEQGVDVDEPCAPPAPYQTAGAAAPARCK